MRTLKKTLCLVLALVLCLGLASTGFAASMDDFTDADQVGAQYEDAVEVMVALGIIDGMGESTLQPEGVYTREQAAKIIAYMTLGETAAEALTADSDPFNDVSKDRWSAGYIAYCAETGIVVGYGDGNYGPTDELTGYQFAKMLLSAVGLGEDNQYEGPNWAINVAKDAFPMGIFEGDVAAATHDSIQRQQAMLMAFNMLTSEMKNSLVMGYQLSSEATNDAWGRPTTTWYKDTQQIAVTDTDPLATHVVAVSECQIADDMGQSGTFSLAIWDNGIESSDTFDATSQAADVGAQGTLIEVYSDRIVLIDTYLAYVSSVSEASYDSNGHVVTAASSTLTVWFDASGTTISGVSDTSYARGTYVLVNYNENTESLSIVQAADSFVGAQTYIQWSEDQHTIAGTVYNDAEQFNKDDAGEDKTENFVWYFDQYGNIIGALEINRYSGYAVLKDIVWVVGSGGTPGYAQATLVYMDGTEATVVVNSIDGINSIDYPYWDVDDAIPTLDDSTTGFTEYPKDVNVSEEPGANTIFAGYAMYLVYTNDDGTVNLEGWEEGTTDTVWVAYHNAATIDVGGSTIKVDDNVVAHVDSSTKFLVKTGNTYTTYEINNLPDFADGTIEVFWSTDGTFTQNVYIKKSIPQATYGTHLFTTSETVGHQVGNTGYYEMVVYVDGLERTIIAEKAITDILVENQGKLFHVTFDQTATSSTYGYVTDVKLVNEASDGTDSADGDCNYLFGDVTVANNAIYDSHSATSYNLTGAVEVIYGGSQYGSVAAAVAAGCDVWVVDDSDNITNRAFTIYVGTELSNDGSITVGSEDANNIADIAPSDHTYNVTLDERNTDGTLSISANNKYAWYTIQVNSDEAITCRGDESNTVTVSLDDTVTVTVYPEDGSGAETWTINVNAYVKIANAITTIKSSGGSVTLGGAESPMAMYSNFDMAIANAVSLTRSDVQEIAIHANNSVVVADVSSADVGTYPGFVAKSHRFTDSANVTETTFDGAADDLYFNDGVSVGIYNISTWNLTDYYVIRMNVRDLDNVDTPNESEYVYFAFQVK